LPEFSRWPSRLLGLEPWEARKKVPSELLREFELDKYGPMWEWANSASHKVTIQEIAGGGWNSTEKLICLDDGELVEMEEKDAYLRQYQIQRTILSGFGPSGSLVELGAGFGGVILRLAREEYFRNAPLFAAEYAASGMKLLNLLAKSQDTELMVGHCDFNSEIITDLTIPPHATIFTSFAAHYVPRYETGFVDTILSWNPSVVVHFEPIYELCNASTLLGALQQRYIQVNDYNRNLLTVLKDAENRGKITIVMEQAQLFGSNPLLPFSVIAWKPAEC
jgi:hypothetical protein